MSSTFAVQSIPPYKPKLATPSDSVLPSDSRSKDSPPSLLHHPHESTSTGASSSARRFSSTGVPGSVSVFELPNPRKMVNSAPESQTSSGVPRGLSQVQEEEGVNEVQVNERKRRAIDDVEGDIRGNESRRSSGESLSEDSTGRRSSNGAIRASFSFPSNPHPHSRPYTNPTRPSVSTMPSPPPRSTPSPRSVLHPGHPDQRSPSTSSKRAKTSAHGPLESLAATASDLLSSSDTSSPTSSSTSTPPTTAATSINSVIGPPSEAQTRDHQAAFEASRQLREDQQREIERRRTASGGGGNQPVPGSVSAALTKLKSEYPQHSYGDDLDRRPESGGTEYEQGGDIDSSGNGLGKRRGHRPPAVTTNSFSPSSSTAVAVATPTRTYEEAMRSAPPGIPSVLVGSPVEATWAARLGKEAGVGSARPSAGMSGVKGGTSGLATSTATVSRRQSTSAAAGGGGTAHSHSRSSHSISSHPRAYSHQPPSSHLMTVNQSRDRHHHHHHSPLPPPSQPVPSPHSHPVPLSHPHERPHGHVSNTRLPPLNSVYPRSVPPLHASSSNLPPSSSSSSSHHPHPHSHSYPHLSHSSISSPPPPHTPIPTSAANSSSSSASAAAAASSKQAFLSLFSTFFDSLQDSRVLTSTLDAQIQRAGSLLSTLQQSEVVLEQIASTQVEERTREGGPVELRWRKDVEASTTALESRVVKRLERLESVVFSTRNVFEREREREKLVVASGGSGGGGGVGLGIMQQRQQHSKERMMEDRLERLERMLSMVQESSRGEDERDRERGSESLPTPMAERNVTKGRGGYSSSSSSQTGSETVSRGALGGVDERE